MKLRSLTAMRDESGLKGTSILWRISIALTIISLTIYTVGVCTCAWVGFEDETFDPERDDHLSERHDPESEFSLVRVDKKVGLWYKCISFHYDNQLAFDECRRMDHEDDWKPASEVLCAVGMALGFLGLVGSFWAGCVQNNNMLGSAGTVVILAGLTGAIGSATFIGKSKDSDDRFEAQYSVFLALIGCALLIVSGGLKLLSIQTGYYTIA